MQLQADALFRTIDLYVDAIATRADAQVASLLAGTDALLADALARPVPGYLAPVAVSYLDSGGRGGAINRARTRLPGGIVLPVALVRVSPESLPARLSSCLHEAGHQLSADLHVLDEGRDVIEAAALRSRLDPTSARQWGLWTGELMADCWNIGLSGGAPGVDGLQRLLSLPTPWLFRVLPNDPHPRATCASSSLWRSLRNGIRTRCCRRSAGAPVSRHPTSCRDRRPEWCNWIAQRLRSPPLSRGTGSKDSAARRWARPARSADSRRKKRCARWTGSVWSASFAHGRCSRSRRSASAGSRAASPSMSSTASSVDGSTLSPNGTTSTRYPPMSDNSVYLRAALAQIPEKLRLWWGGELKSLREARALVEGSGTLAQTDAALLPLQTVKEGYKFDASILQRRSSATLLDQLYSVSDELVPFSWPMSARRSAIRRSPRSDSARSSAP